MFWGKRQDEVEPFKFLNEKKMVGKRKNRRRRRTRRWWLSSKSWRVIRRTSKTMILLAVWRIDQRRDFLSYLWNLAEDENNAKSGWVLGLAAMDCCQQLWFRVWTEAQRSTFQKISLLIWYCRDFQPDCLTVEFCSW